MAELDEAEVVKVALDNPEGLQVRIRKETKQALPPRKEAHAVVFVAVEFVAVVVVVVVVLVVFCDTTPGILLKIFRPKINAIQSRVLKTARCRKSVHSTYNVMGGFKVNVCVISGTELTHTVCKPISAAAESCQPLGQTFHEASNSHREIVANLFHRLAQSSHHSPWHGHGYFARTRSYDAHSRNCADAPGHDQVVRRGLPAGVSRRLLAVQIGQVVTLHRDDGPVDQSVVRSEDGLGPLWPAETKRKLFDLEHPRGKQQKHAHLLQDAELPGVPADRDCRHVGVAQVRLVELAPWRI